MNIYDFNDIKAAGDCVDYCTRILGLAPQGKSGKWTKFNSPLRPGSDSGAFSVSREGFHDHVSSESGSIIDLCALARHGGDLFAAAAELGPMYNVKPRSVTRQRRRFVCAYDYKDADGTVLFQVVRWEPKSFSQRRPDPEKPGEWIRNIEGVKLVPYRLPEWKDRKSVCIVGGEKDADNLWKLGVAATTNQGGEGNWKAEYAKHFVDKDVCVIPDQDEIGKKHAEAVVFSLKDVACRVKIVNLPDVKDVSDWIELQLGEVAEIRAALMDMVRAAPMVSMDAAVSPSEDLTTAADAKKANRTPFSNYVWGEGVDERGNTRKAKIPRMVRDMTADVLKRFQNFPRRAGSVLFDHDHDTGRIRTLDRAASLIAWIAEKSKHPVEWTRNVEGCIGQDQFYEAMLAVAPYVDSISNSPNWPEREGVYYTFRELPKPDPQAARLNEFLEFFSPATAGDKILLRALVASPMYHRPRQDRPLWVIDAEHGQGTGKTKLVEFIAYLYGGDDDHAGYPLMVDHNQINNETQLDRITRGLLSESGRRKKIMLLDNVDCYFKSPALSTMITQSSVSGLAPYGRGVETRPMDLTVIITSNSAEMDRDLIHRSMFVHLSKPENPIPDWTKKLSKFVRDHRLQILADIMGILERGPTFDAGKTATRFEGWERDVMIPMVGDMESYSLAIKTNFARHQGADADADDADVIREAFVARIAGMGHNPKPEYGAYWLTSAVIQKWATDAIEGFGGRNGRAATRVIRNMVKAGLIPELSTEIDLYPRRGDGRKRGAMWNIEAYRESQPVWIISMDAEGVIGSQRDES